MSSASSTLGKYFPVKSLVTLLGCHPSAAAKAFWVSYRALTRDLSAVHAFLISFLDITVWC